MEKSLVVSCIILVFALLISFTVYPKAIFLAIFALCFSNKDSFCLKSALIFGLLYSLGLEGWFGAYAYFLVAMATIILTAKVLLGEGPFVFLVLWSVFYYLEWVAKAEAVKINFSNLQNILTITASFFVSFILHKVFESINKDLNKSKFRQLHF